MNSPPPPDDSLVDEYRSLKQFGKKLLAMACIGCLIVAKLFSIAYVKHHFGWNSKLVHFTAYLSIVAIAFLTPLYFIAGIVKGYGLFLVCACASLVNDSAEFFLFLGIFGVGSCVIFELVHFFVLLIVLTIIENLFKDEENAEQQNESIPLADFNDNGEMIGSDGMTDAERQERQLEIWREFRSALRSASL